MSVHFKFKSEKEFGTINFPGTTIRVIDLKKGIIEQKKLNKGQDMELVITDFQNNTATTASGGAETVEDELEALNAIQQEAEEARSMRGGGNKTWTATGGAGFKGGPPGMYAGGRGGGYGGRGPPPMGGRGGGPSQPLPGDNLLDTPPQGYVCYRCGVPGHFIQNCPTNGNANHDKHMVKPRTGIPTSLIKAVEGPNQAPGFTVVNTGPNGGLAIVVPQVKAFEKLVKSSGGGSGIDQYRLVPPDHLACPICKRLMQDAVLIPCCHELIPNKGTRSSVDEFLKRSQSEAQERERLVKEAEAKALQKQLEAEDTTSQRRVEIADAVLDISKKPKDDDDDDLGGDLFAEEPEKVESPTKQEMAPQPATQPAPTDTAEAPTEQPPPSVTATTTDVKAEEAGSIKPNQDKPLGSGPPPGGRDRSAERKGDRSDKTDRADKGDDKGSPRSKSRRSRERRRGSRDRKSSRHRSRSRSRRRDRSTERESSRKSATRDSKSDKRDLSDRERKGRSSSVRKETDSKERSTSRRGSERNDDDRHSKDRSDDRKDRADDKRSGAASASTPSEKSRDASLEIKPSSLKDEKAAASKPVEAPAIDLDFLEEDPTTVDKPVTKNESTKREVGKESSRRKSENDDWRDRNDKRSDRHDRHDSDRKTSDRKGGDHRRNSDRKVERTDERKSDRKGDDRRRGDKKDDGLRDGDRKEKKADKKRSSERPSSRDDKRSNDSKRRRSRSRERNNRSSERKVTKKVEAEEPPKKKKSVFERLGPAVKK
ncbi:hypothetical protein DYB32_001713 [Aphanomyces invadans]|uniref:CCHC-type domain-containing protein n=1 Tax=Aphanomyces invadans TaxID=157072 RepID=A0A418B5D0_9STRA|nr:hypothetical protein DYB32_001713 [Aphanomyces invadans]